VALGPLARLVAAVAPGSAVRVGGFLAARSLKQTAPVLHATDIEFIEGN